MAETEIKIKTGLTEMLKGEDGSEPCRSVSQGVGRMFCLPKTAWPPTWQGWLFCVGLCNMCGSA